MFIDPLQNGITHNSDTTFQSHAGDQYLPTPAALRFAVLETKNDKYIVSPNKSSHLPPSFPSSIEIHREIAMVSTSHILFFVAVSMCLVVLLLYTVYSFYTWYKKCAIVVPSTPTGPSKPLNMNNFAPERPCHTFEIEEPVTPRARTTGPDAFRSVMNTIRLFNDDPRMWFSKCMNKIPQFWHVHKNSHSPEPTWISTDVYYYRSRLPAIPELPEPENDE